MSDEESKKYTKEIIKIAEGDLEISKSLEQAKLLCKDLTN